MTGWVVMLLLLAPSGSGIEPTFSVSQPTGISDCREITAPGQYELTANLSTEGPESCVRILADDVVLDGQGHVVRSTSSTRSLIAVENASNVSVGRLATVGGVAGITFWNVTGGRIENVTANRAARMGIWVVDSTAIEVVGATVSWNAFSGIRLDDTTNSVVSRSTATNNAAGLALGRSRRNRIRDNQFSRNRIGIELAGAHRNNLTRNLLVANDFGMVLAVSPGNTIANNSFRRNIDGIRLDEADDNLILDNHLVDHEFGLYLNGATGNTLRRNVIERARVGIELTFSSDGNTLVGNGISARESGIRQTVSRNNTLVENQVVLNDQETETAQTPTEHRVASPSTEAAPSTTERSIDPPTAPGFGPLLAGLAILATIALVLGWHRIRPPGR